MTSNGHTDTLGELLKLRLDGKLTAGLGNKLLDAEQAARDEQKRLVELDKLGLELRLCAKGCSDGREERIAECVAKINELVKGAVKS